jgi:peptidoglycan/LPS O-acetylase OafA/YrhL
MVRIKELDVFRGIAALNVVVFHYTSRYRMNFGHNYPIDYDWNLGRYGVELFFMISGFVIFMSLQGNTSITSFAKKRFTRLYPEYWICVCLTFLVLNIAADPKVETVSPPVLLLNLTMIQGVFNVKSVDGVYWSLIPELFFYFAIGLLYYLGLLSRIRIFGTVWLTLMILNSLVGLPFGAYLLNLQYGMFFMAGILFYRIKFDQGGWQEHALILLSFVAALCSHPGMIQAAVYLLFYLIFYMFVYGFLNKISWKPLVFLGYISYPLYLIHQNIGFILMRTLGRYLSSDVLIVLLTIATMITLAWLITSLTRAVFILLSS